MIQRLIGLALLLTCGSVFANEHISCPTADEVKQNLRAIVYGRPSSGDVHADVSAKLQVGGHDATGFARLARYEVYRGKQGPLPIADYVTIKFTPEKTKAVAENASDTALLTCRYWLDYNATWPAFWEGEVWYASKIDYRENYFNLLLKVEKSRCTASGAGFDCEKI
jgi:hypothetical protein